MTCVHDLHLKPYLTVYKNLSAALAAQLVNRDKDLIATTDAYHRPVRVHTERPGKGLQAKRTNLSINTGVTQWLARSFHMFKQVPVYIFHSKVAWSFQL